MCVYGVKECVRFRVRGTKSFTYTLVLYGASDSPPHQRVSPPLFLIYSVYSPPGGMGGSTQMHSLINIMQNSILPTQSLLNSSKGRSSACIVAPKLPPELPPALPLPCVWDAVYAAASSIASSLAFLFLLSVSISTISVHLRATFYSESLWSAARSHCSWQQWLFLLQSS